MTHVKAYTETKNGKLITVPEHDDKRQAARPSMPHQRIAMGQHKDGSHYLRAAGRHDARRIRHAAQELGIDMEHRLARARHNGEVGDHHHFHATDPKAVRKVYDHIHGQGMAKESRHVFGNHEAARDAYAKNESTKGGKKIDVDEARELVPSYRENRTKGAAIIHDETSRFANRLFEERLAMPIESPKESVLFLAGGGGSGKGTAAGRFQLEDAAHTIWDGTMAKFSSADKKVQQALASGRRAEIAFVYRPVEKAVEGMVGRAHGSGRIVPLDILADAHKGAIETMQKMVEKYRGNPHVHLTIIDNSGDAMEDAKRVPDGEMEHFLKNHAYDEGIAKKTTKAYTRIRENGYEHGGQRKAVREEIQDALDHSMRALHGRGAGGQEPGASGNLPGQGQEPDGGGNQLRKRGELGRKGPKGRGIQKAHVKGHIRVVDGKVVWVHDHETRAKGRAAKLHERTALGQHKAGSHYLRATDADDAATILKVIHRTFPTGRTADGRPAFVKVKETGTHLGEKGSYTTFHFHHAEDAARVLGELAKVEEAPEQIQGDLLGMMGDHSPDAGKMAPDHVGEPTELIPDHSGDATKKVEEGPGDPDLKPGDTMEKGGKTYVLNQNHRWELSEHDKAVSHHAHHIKQEDRRDRLEEAADSANREAGARANTANKISERFYMGQPIIRGHHSEKGARRDQARMDSNMRASIEAKDKAADLSYRAAGVGRAGISSDDASAVDQLRAKLAKLENERDAMKAINKAHAAYLKKPESLDKSDLPESYKKIIRDYKPQYSWEPHPIPPYRLSGMSGKIGAAKKRIEELEEETHKRATMDEAQIEQTWTLDGHEVTITEDHDDNRLEVDFGRDRHLTPEQFETMKAQGFHYNGKRSGTVFTRKLNDSSRYWATDALKRMGAVQTGEESTPAEEQAPAPEAKPTVKMDRLAELTNYFLEKETDDLRGLVGRLERGEAKPHSGMFALPVLKANLAVMEAEVAKRITADAEALGLPDPGPWPGTIPVETVMEKDGAPYMLMRDRRWEKMGEGQIAMHERMQAAKADEQAPAPEGPKEGDRDGLRGLVFRDHRWHREQDTMLQAEALKGPDQEEDSRPGNYYVSAVDGPKRWLIAGPYPTHAEALDMVREVKDRAIAQEPKAHFYGWGTARTELDTAKKTPMGPVKPGFEGPAPHPDPDGGPGGGKPTETPSDLPSIETDTGSSESPASPAPTEEPAAVAAEPLTIEAQHEVAGRIRKGETTPAELVAEWERFKAGRPSLRAELEGLSKAKMIERLKGTFRIDPKTKLTQKEIVKAVLDSMGNAYQVQGSFSWSPFTETHEQAMDRVIQATTAEQIADYAARVTKASEDRKAEHARVKAAIENPQTLEDFETRARYKVPALTAEQTRRWEDLKADAQRAAVAPKAAFVQAVGLGDVAMELHESKHTKTGEDLHVVTLSQRVDRDLYNTLNERAKKLGGWYSSYRGNGAIPGFTFKNPESAKAFMATEQGQIAPPAIPAEQVQAERQAKVSSRLRDMAEAMIEKADGELGRDRQTNTHKRADQAGHSIAQAEGQKALAQTMLNLSEAIEDGRAKHLGGLKNRAQIETLDGVLDSARRNRWNAEKLTYAQTENLKHGPYNLEDADHAEYPYPTMWGDHMPGIVAKLEKVPGASRVAAKLKKMIPANQDGPVQFDTPDKVEVYAAATDKFLKATDHMHRYEGQNLKDRLARFARLQSAGIETPEQLRAALREFLVYKTMAKGEDPIRAAERSLVGAKFPGYFPTPKTLADEVVAKAGIEPGMKILEPSAGKGNLIDSIHQAHGKDLEVEAIEPINALRTILEAKGHSVVGRDILEHNPGEVYDRVVMNPPFENGQDMEHVRHAFDLLKPGGRLVAITSPAPYFHSTKKAEAFRDWLDSMGAVYEPNPEGSFKESGTGVNTYTLTIDKPKGNPVPKGDQDHPVAAGPITPPKTHQPGETKIEGGITYRMNQNHRWEKVESEPLANRSNGAILEQEEPTMTGITYTFPEDVSIPSLRGKTVTGGVFQKRAIEGKPQDVVYFEKGVDEHPIVLRIAGKPDLEAAFSKHHANINAHQKAMDDALEASIPGVHKVLALADKVSNDEYRYAEQFNRMMEDEQNDGVRPPRSVNSANAQKLAGLLKEFPRAALYLEAKRQKEGSHWADNTGKGAAGDNAMGLLRGGSSLESAKEALLARREFVD